MTGWQLIDATTPDDARADDRELARAWHDSTHIQFPDEVVTPEIAAELDAVIDEGQRIAARFNELAAEDGDYWHCVEMAQFKVLSAGMAEIVERKRAKFYAQIREEMNINE